MGFFFRRLTMMKLWLALVTCLVNSISAFAQPMLNDPNLTVSLVASGLDMPTQMVFIGSDDILVLQKNDGKVMRITNGVLQPTPVLDVDVDPRSFGGLLGIALHPNFQTNKYVYLRYIEGNTGIDTLGSAVDNGNRVYRYTWDSATGTLTNATLILSLPISQVSGNYGGVMTFGPDGKLYVVMGDLGGTGRLQNNPSGAPPNDTSVILRLNDDGTTPKNNPFFSQGDPVARYFAYGIRNSFGMAFDPVTEKLWNTENGPANWDEINLVERGFNSGWTKLQGPVSRDADGDTTADLFSLPRSRYADPKFSWFESVGVTGIAFLDSTKLGPEYENNIFVGDYVFSNLYRFQLNKKRDGLLLLDDLADKVADNSNERNDARIGQEFNGITDLKVGHDGLLYVLSLFDGAIYVIHPVVEFGVSSVPDGELGAAYNINLNFTGGTAPYVVTVVDGSLPAGLNILNGSITGTPTEMKKASFTLQVTEQGGATTIKSFNVRIYGALSIVTKRLRAGRVGRRYVADLNSKGGKGPYTWTLAAGTLPSALTLEAATGKITGTPDTTTNTNLTLQVADTLGVAVQKAFALVIE
jgi:glucose/arabinose dehydrogenase